MNIESQRNIKKLNSLVELIFTLFPLPYKVLTECQHELLKNKKRRDNTLILDYNPEEWHTQIITTIRNIFYLSIKHNYNLSQLNLINLYKKLLIIFIRLEDWDKVEELIVEIVTVNKWLKDDENHMINPLDTLDHVLYVLLHLNKKDLFIKTVDHLEEACTTTKNSLSIFIILSSIGIYCYKWRKTEELSKVGSSLLNIALSNPEFEKEFDNIRESYGFSLDEGYFLTHAIGIDRKTGFSSTDREAFKKEYYLEKIKKAKRASNRIKTISQIRSAQKESIKLKQNTIKKQNEEKKSKGTQRKKKQ